MRVRAGILFREVDETPPAGERLIFVLEETPNTQHWSSCFRFGHFRLDPSAFAGGVFVETLVGEGDYQEPDEAEPIEEFDADRVLCWAYIPKVTGESFA